MAPKIEPSPLATGALEPALVTILDGCNFLAASKAEIYRLLGRKKIEGVKRGKRTLLVVPSLKAHAASLPQAKIKPPITRKRKGA